MSSSHQKQDRLIDQGLRDVPLPEGLLARLTDIADETDDKLDDRLRAVPIPEGLTSRLTETLADGHLDDTVIDIRVPTGLIRRLRRIPPRQVRRRSSGGLANGRFSFGQMVLAASLLFAMGLSYIAFKYNLGGGPTAVDGGPELTQDNPDNSDSTNEIETNTGGKPRFAGPIDDGELPVFQGDPIDLEFELFQARLGLKNMFEQMAANLPQTPPDWGEFLAVPLKLDQVRPLETVRPLTTRGVRPPLVRGYDRIFLSKYFVHPFVSPSAHKSLKTSNVPLVSETTSFELLLDRLKSGQATGDVAIRTEEFLAAMSYRFDEPLGQSPLALHTAVGPSPFERPGVLMMQIGVQAGQVAAKSRRPTHMTIAIDVSASMRWQSRLPKIRKALLSLIDRLEPDDRLSIVTFSDKARLLIDNATIDDRDKIRRVVLAIRQKNATNVGAGLRLACETALRGRATKDDTQPRNSELIVLTDGLTAIEQEVTDRIGRMLSHAHQNGVELTMLDLSSARNTDPFIHQFAEDGDGRVFPAKSAREIGWRLQERLCGQSQVVATDAQLSIKFNPESVHSYRLVGHEAMVTEGLTSDSMKTDLRTQESVTALYEIRLKPGAKHIIATARLKWRDPKNGKAASLDQPITRVQVASSFYSSPPALQFAILTAETAELMRGSYYTKSQAHSLRNVHDVANKLFSRLGDQASFQKLMRMVHLADQSGMDRERSAAQSGNGT